jgi:hypothetical protein
VSRVFNRLIDCAQFGLTRKRRCTISPKARKALRGATDRRPVNEPSAISCAARSETAHSSGPWTALRVHQRFGELAGRGACTQTGHLPPPEAEIIRISRLVPDSLVEEKGRIGTHAWVSSQFSSFADTVNEGLGPARADVRARGGLNPARTHAPESGPSRSRARRSSPIIHEWAKPSCCKACSGGIRCVGSSFAWLLIRAAYVAGQPQRPSPPFQRNGVASAKGVNAPDVPTSRECLIPPSQLGIRHARPLRAFNQRAHAGREVGDRSRRSE